MVLKDRGLWCEECERFEGRKLSTRYGVDHPTGVEHVVAKKTEE